MLYPEVTGQNNNKAILTRAFTSGNIPHAWLFSGSSGGEQLQMALSYAKSLLCDSPKEQYCSACESCHLYDLLNHPDFFHLKPRGKIRQMKMEDVKELMRFLSLKSYRSGYKVIVIEEAERLPREHANKLLKSLEEPPEKTVFILTCAKESGILPTIISRCQLLEFLPLDEKTLLEWLERQRHLPLEAKLLAKLSNGEIGNLKETQLETLIKNRALAFSIIEDWLLRGRIAIMDGTQRITDSLEKEKKQHEKEIAQELKKLKGEGATQLKKLEEQLDAHSEGILKQSLDGLLEVIAGFLRDAILFREGISIDHIKNFDKKEALLAASGKIPYLERKIEMLDKTRRALQRTANQKLALETLLLEIFP